MGNGTSTFQIDQLAACSSVCRAQAGSEAGAPAAPAPPASLTARGRGRGRAWRRAPSWGTRRRRNRRCRSQHARGGWQGVPSHPPSAWPAVDVARIGAVSPARVAWSGGRSWPLAGAPQSLAGWLPSPAAAGAAVHGWEFWSWSCRN
ncbi:hypothetical protein GQ55_4G282600 [Panicum hallii var. hallii]|uniref:Uncharacterized protein n=1 Tax=Panicum hallii var. hallii TaxID=1504633 RepID=A0A2T7E117_9POAL|nr:hypothetical protein GQ55_4G282600 [Panicum hallii var. hallii]